MSYRRPQPEFYPYPFKTISSWWVNNYPFDLCNPNLPFMFCLVSLPLFEVVSSLIRFKLLTPSTRLLAEQLRTTNSAKSYFLHHKAIKKRVLEKRKIQCSFGWEASSLVSCKAENIGWAWMANTYTCALFGWGTRRWRGTLRQGRGRLVIILHYLDISSNSWIIKCLVWKCAPLLRSDQLV